MDRTRWSTEIARYATASYTNLEDEKRTLEAFQELKHSDSGVEGRDITMGMLMQARASLKPGAAPGSDGI
eukprot:2639241-Pyramimonas_sp.AAC.1